MRGERQQHLRAGGAHPGDERCGQEGHRPFGQGDAEARDDRADGGDEREPLVLEQIAERHDKREAEAVAELSKHRDHAGGAR